MYDDLNQPHMVEADPSLLQYEDKQYNTVQYGSTVQYGREGHQEVMEKYSVDNTLYQSTNLSTFNRYSHWLPARLD